MAISAVETLTLASLFLLLGYVGRKWLPVLDRLNISASVIGGFVMSLLVVVLQRSASTHIKFDLVTEQPLMIAFFTSIGFGAGVSLLRQGGPKVVLLLLLSSIVAILQGAVGAAIARVFGLNPLYGVLTGTVTLSGGPATAMAFAPLFQSAGVNNAATIGIATAMAGIVIAGIFGGPLATFIINRDKLAHARAAPPISEVLRQAPAPTDQARRDPVFDALAAIALVLLSMWAGTKLSNIIQSAGVTLPGYIGSMVVAAALRNWCDLTGWFKLPHVAIEIIGAITLSLFLTMALMSIDLSSLADLALPFFINLVAQTAMAALLLLWPIYRLMGRDYEAAVTNLGRCGFPNTQ